MTGPLHGWKKGNFHGLFFAVPTIAKERSETTKPNRDGYLERAWNGGPISGTTATMGNGGPLAEYLVQSSTTAVFDGAVPVGGRQVFALKVPGAKVAAGSLDEQPVPSPGNGKLLRLHVYIQTAKGMNYQAGMTASNDSVGQTMVREFLGALSVL